MSCAKVNEYVPDSEGQTGFSREADTLTATPLGTFLFYCGIGIVTELESGRPEGGPELGPCARPGDTLPTPASPLSPFQRDPSLHVPALSEATVRQPPLLTPV